MASDHPAAQRLGHCIQMPCEEMIASGNENHAGGLRGFRIKSLNKAFEMRLWGVLIVFSLNQEFRFRACTQVVEWQFAIVDGQPESDQLRDSGIRATCAQADPRAEAEAGSKQGNARKVGLEIIERGADVIFFPTPMI